MGEVRPRQAMEGDPHQDRRQRLGDLEGNPLGLRQRLEDLEGNPLGLRQHQEAMDDNPLGLHRHLGDLEDNLPGLHRRLGGMEDNLPGRRRHQEATNEDLHPEGMVEVCRVEIMPMGHKKYRNLTEMNLLRLCHSNILAKAR